MQFTLHLVKDTGIKSDFIRSS